MTTYLLDTNACLALINGSEANVRRRFQRAVARESVILLSSIVAFELWYGVAKSQRKESNARRLDAFFAGPLEWTLFDEEDARAAGTIRAELEAIGKPIGAYDVLLAGQARRHGATLVTFNTKVFTRVSDLKSEDWAASRR
jgi:tRNA(fMet)-specific endonuclease VapC